ncbi:MAG: hypothetical protein GC159_21055 [Phycisphaera sp.]|nr:hypothetical protein [Phycisphaera sp.]
MKLRKLLILEDDTTLVDRFRAVLGDDLHAEFWNDAHRMARRLKRTLPGAALISLDHRLMPPLGMVDDLGDGMTVVRALCTYEPTCPVLVHADEREAATAMVERLTRAGWRATRLEPGGIEWIENDWIEAVRQHLPVSL